MNIYVLLHFENKNDVMIIVKPKGASRYGSWLYIKV